MFVVKLGGAEFFELLLVCKAFDFFVKSEWDHWWGEQFSCRFFSFIILNMFCHSLLACKVSTENQLIDSCWGDFLVVTFCLSLAAFRILSLTFAILIISWYEFLCLGFTQMLESVRFCLLQNWKHFQLLFLWVLFHSYPLSPSLLELQWHECQIIF